ncbi:MAG: hypothetical protein AAF682_26550 [Planctomycetota bacterium]
MAAADPASAEGAVALAHDESAARRAAGDRRRLRVTFEGGAPAPVELRVYAEAGAVRNLDGDATRGWQLAREELIVAVQAPGFAPEVAALEAGGGYLVLRLQALGEVRMRARAGGAPAEGVLAFLALSFADTERTSAERRLRFGECETLLDGTHEPELFGKVFERLRELPYDDLDRVLATLGERDLSGMTDARGEVVWSGIPAQRGLSIELDTDFRCADAEGNPALSKVEGLSREEFLVREIEEKRSGRFDLTPGGAVTRTFACERPAVVRGRISPFEPGAEGTVLVRDVRTDLTVDGISLLATNEKRTTCDPSGRFALVVQPGRKRLQARWVEDGCQFTADREIHLAPGADLDLGELAPPPEQQSLTLRPVLTDDAGNLLAWQDHAGGPPPTVLFQYRVMVDDAGLLDAPERGATDVQEARCRIGESVRLCGLPAGELRLTTLLEWGLGSGPPEGLSLRRGAGKQQRIPVRAGSPREAQVPFVTEVPYDTTVVVHPDGQLVPADGLEVTGMLLRLGAQTQLTTVGQRDAYGGLKFDFRPPAGSYVFYAQLPGTRSDAGAGIFALTSVVVGTAPRVDAAWTRGVRVEVVPAEGSWSPTADPVELQLRTQAGEVYVPIRSAEDLDGVPPGSGIELVAKKRGYFLGVGNDLFRIPLDD